MDVYCARQVHFSFVTCGLRVPVPCVTRDFGGGGGGAGCWQGQHLDLVEGLLTSPADFWVSLSSASSSIRRAPNHTALSASEHPA